MYSFRFLLISFLLCFVVGGVVFGLSNGDCDGTFVCYLFSITVIGFLNIIFLGFIPANTGDVGERLNVWPTIFVLWCIVLLKKYLYSVYRKT